MREYAMQFGINITFDMLFRENHSIGKKAFQLNRKQEYTFEYAA